MEMKMGGLLDLKDNHAACREEGDTKGLIDEVSEDAERDLHACLEDCVQVDHLFRSEPFENQPNTP